MSSKNGYDFMSLSLDFVWSTSDLMEWEESKFAGVFLCSQEIDVLENCFSAIKYLVTNTNG